MNIPNTPVNLHNWLDQLMVAEVNQSEIHESQYHAPTNVNRRCEIANNKSKSRTEKNNSPSIRLYKAITKNEIKGQSKYSIRTVTGNRSYASTAW